MRSTKGIFILMVMLGVLVILGLPARAGEPLPIRGGLSPPAQDEARYLAGLHDRIHPLWVQTVISRSMGNLPPYHPFHAPGRQVTLRLVLRASGEIRSARVVRSSGHGPFDEVAWALMLGIHDYPTPPSSLRSDDGDVHVEWTLHRHRPWCHHSNARVLVLPFTDTLLARGDVLGATRLLAQASKEGLLSQYARPFAMELLRQAIGQPHPAAKWHLGRFLKESNPPPGLVAAALRGARDPAARRALVSQIAQHRTPENIAALSRLCSEELTRDPPDLSALMVGLSAAPPVARQCLPAARGVRAESHRGKAGRAVVLLMAGEEAERLAAHETLRSLLGAREDEARLAALEVMGRRSHSPELLERLKAVALGPALSMPVSIALVSALRRVGTEAAGRVLLMMSYTRRAALASEVVSALGDVEGPALARCYRLMTMIRSPRTATAVLRAAARGFARRCARDHLPEVRRVARSPHRAVRQGLAEGLSPEAKPQRPLLLRLAQSSFQGVRLAALETLHRNGQAPSLPSLASLLGAKSLREVVCPKAQDRADQAACLASVTGEARLSLLRRYLSSSPELVMPEIIRRLSQSTWSSRLEAAWILLGLPAF